MSYSYLIELGLEKVTGGLENSRVNGNIQGEAEPTSHLKQS
jgi:hypothetical protein